MIIYRRRIVALAVAAIALSAHAQQSVDDKLKGFDEYMAQVMRDWNVPGIGVGIVVKGKLVFAKGYGYRDYGKKLPYTPTTVQPIASNTKLFTATAVGMLVDQGKIDWDKPIRDYVPSLKFYDDYLDRTITVRDMLSHRTGITRHDLIWFKSDFTQKELFERVKYLEPAEPPRTIFLYNNLMYSAAGYSVQLLSGKPWQQFVTEHILQPLDMKSTTFTIEDMVKLPEPGVPYTEHREGTELYRIPYYSDAIGVAPAGAINSNIEDLSHWLIAQMNGGVYQGRQVIPPDVIRETLAPAMPLPNTTLMLRGWGELLNVVYGMGRETGSYRGHLVALHGGDLPGFHSQVSMMPYDSIGVIVLVIGDHAAPLYNIVSWNVYERMLGMSLTPWSERQNAIRLQAKAADKASRAKAGSGRVSGTKPSHPIADYVGEYEHPAYGVLTISQGDTSLLFDFHKIKLPLSHFHYDRFDSPDDEQYGKWSLLFLTNFQGEVDRVQVSVDENAITFTRRVPAELSSVATLGRYVGMYATPTGTKFNVTILPDSTLALQYANGQVQRLIPWRPERFHIKEFPDVVYTFIVANGKVTGLKASDPSGETTFPKM